MSTEVSLVEVGDDLPKWELIAICSVKQHAFWKNLNTNEIAYTKQAPPKLNIVDVTNGIKIRSHLIVSNPETGEACHTSASARGCL